MDFSDILSLVGMATGSGGILGAIMAIARRLFAANERKQEQTKRQKELEAELKLEEARASRASYASQQQLRAIQEQAKLHMQIIHQQAKAAQRQAVYQHDSATYYSKGAPKLLAVADFLRAIVRPGMALYSLLIVSVVMVIGLISGALGNEAMFAVGRAALSAICGILAYAQVYYFDERGQSAEHKRLMQRIGQPARKPKPSELFTRGKA